MGNEPYSAIRTNFAVNTGTYKVRIDRRISKPEDWHEELDTIRAAGQGDVLELYINTQGGYDTTMKAILAAILETEATTIGIIEGDCSSAGGPIFLACDQHKVYPLSNLMIHTGSGGYSGSIDNISQYSEHAKKDNRNIIEGCYEGFITQEEMEDVMLGKDIWLCADEIVDRLNQRQQYFLDKEPKLSLEEHVELLQQDLVEYAKENNVVHEDLVKKICEALGVPPTPSEVQNITETSPFSTKTVKVKVPLPLEPQVSEDTVAMLQEEFKNDVYHLTVFADGRLDDHSDEPLFTSFVKVCAEKEMGLDDLKGYAELLGVPFAYNISLKTLAVKVDKKLEEVVDSLNVK